MSDYQLVKEFTDLAGGFQPVDVPTPMSKSEVYFLVTMMLDEIMELFATVAGPEETKESMINMIRESRNLPQESGSPEEITAAQADAMVDCYVYMLNAAAKKNVDLSSVFKVVHRANTAKIVDGKVLRREDGKILKPPGWTAPDITSEIKRQICAATAGQCAGTD